MKADTCLRTASARPKLSSTKPYCRSRSRSSTLLCPKAKYYFRADFVARRRYLAKASPGFLRTPAILRSMPPSICLRRSTSVFVSTQLSQPSNNVAGTVS
eukprot:7693940-Pyramimonas_sp.AAC.1